MQKGGKLDSFYTLYIFESQKAGIVHFPPKTALYVNISFRDFMLYDMIYIYINKHTHTSQLNRQSSHESQ